MRNEDFYPAGACYDTNAPYNEVYTPECDFDIEVTETLVRKTTVTTDKYREYIDEENGQMYTDTDDTNFEEVYYSDEGHYEISDLLNILKEYVQHDLSMTGDRTDKGRRLRQILADCEGWVTDDKYVEEY